MTIRVKMILLAEWYFSKVPWADCFRPDSFCRQNTTGGKTRYDGR